MVLVIGFALLLAKPFETDAIQNESYFKVVHDVDAYDNRTGKLVSIGIIKEGTVLKLRSIEGNWVSFFVGEDYFYVHNSAIELQKEPDHASKFANDRKDKIYFRNDGNIKIYENPNKDKVVFELAPRGSFPIYRDNGDFYEVLVGSRVGFIDKSEVEPIFTLGTLYFTVDTDDVPYYDNRSGKLVEVGILKKGNVYKRFGDYGANWHAIEIGGKKRFIAKYRTTPAFSDGKNRDGSKNYVSTITTKGETVIYENISGRLVPIGKLGGSETINSNSPIGSDWYEVNVSGRVGHVYHTSVKPEFTSAHLYYSTNMDQVPIYDNSGGKLVEVGKLKSGTIFKRIRDFSANWHEIEIGGVKRYVAKFATIPAEVDNTANQLLGTLFTKITLQKDIDVVENRQGVLVPTLSLKKGEVLYSNSPLGSNWYRVVVSGREGFIHHTAVSVKGLPRDVVNPYQTYTYETMLADIRTLSNMYPGLISTQVIGKSVDGRDLIAVKLGKGNKEITVNGSHHAREHLTTNILMEMLDQYAYSYEMNSSFANYPVRKILDHVSIWFVPMVNPDGVTLVQKGHKSAKNPQNVLNINGGSTNFSAWKANIRGVDLNRQYDANWSNIKGNPGKPSPENYKGIAPFSEPETRAMRDFVLSHPFEVGVAYHSSGEIIYWNFKQTGSQLSRDLQLATQISKMTGYSLVPARKDPSGGGFTDWFIQTQKRPAFTPEISPYVGNKPVPISNFTDAWNRNKAVVIMLADYASKQ